MRTVSLPCVTAAGLTRTAELITTVPVRALTMTRAGGSAATTSRFSISLISVARTSAPVGARAVIETPSNASAVPAPRRVLIAAATFWAVVKSAWARLKVITGLVSKQVAPARGPVGHAAGGGDVDDDLRTFLAFGAESSDG